MIKDIQHCDILGRIPGGGGAGLIDDILACIEILLVIDIALIVIRSVRKTNNALEVLIFRKLGPKDRTVIDCKVEDSRLVR